MNKIVKPKTHKGKRVIESKEPQLVEDTKSVLFIKGTRTSEVCAQVLKDLAMLKKPHTHFYSRKNDIRPMEDATSLEFFTQKSGTPLFLFTSHNKKRPHNLVMGRTFDDQILDLVELGVESYKSLKEFKVHKIPQGTKPMLLFSGAPFEEEEEGQRLKNLLIDFFKGPEVDGIRLAGLEHVISFAAVDGKIIMKSYRVLMKKSGTKIPRIELEEIGPSAEFVIRRTKLASQDLFKRALKQPKQLKLKKTKNIEKDKLGTTFGRIHMTKQDLGTLQVRKMKSLKKNPKNKVKRLR